MPHRPSLILHAPEATSSAVALVHIAVQVTLVDDAGAAWTTVQPLELPLPGFWRLTVQADRGLGAQPAIRAVHEGREVLVEVTARMVVP